MESIVTLTNLSKRFKKLIAVNKVDLKIKRGEIFGLLGPNGAGKTTIIKILCTLLRPSSGTAKINGYNILKEKHGVRSSIGVVFQDQSIDEELTAYENLVFHGKVYNMKMADIKSRAAKLLKLVELEDKKDKLVGEFSGGMRRRLEIARGLMHKPKVLFLDEPTVGLDPQTRNKIWDYIKKLNKESDVTIILTTHYMEEADKLCNWVGIIDRGKVIAYDSPMNLKDKLGGDTITIGADDPIKFQKALKDVKSIQKMTCHKKGLILSTKQAEKKIAKIIKALEDKGLSPKTVSIHNPTLEDVFLHFTGRKIREETSEGFAGKVRMMRR